MPFFRALTAFFCLLLSLFLAGFSSLASAQALQPVPPLTARVTDQTGTLTQAQRGLLEAKLANFERQKGAQIAVLLVPTVKPESIEQYSLRVVEAWKLGRKGVDNGALLIVAREDRKLRIEVGYGLEGALNDATAKRIISETIAPRFKQGDFAGGIEAGVDAMLLVVAGETLPPPAAATARESAAAGFDFETWLALGFGFIFVIGGILRAIFGRFLASTIVGVAAGFIASLFIASLLLAGLIGLGAFLLSLLLGKSGRGGGSGGHWSSSSWGSSSGGSSDSGGFSGGGGDFGGGGASGDW